MVLVSIESVDALNLRPASLTIWVAQLSAETELTVTELALITGMTRTTVRRGVAELVSQGLSAHQSVTPPAPTTPDPAPVRLQTLQLDLQDGAEPVYWPIVVSLPDLDRLEAMGLLAVVFKALDGLSLRQYRELMAKYAPRADGGEVEVLRKMAEYAELPSFLKRRRAHLTFNNWLERDYKQRGKATINATSQGSTPGPYDFERLSTGSR